MVVIMNVILYTLLRDLEHAYVMWGVRNMLLMWGVAKVTVGTSHVTSCR